MLMILYSTCLILQSVQSDSKPMNNTFKNNKMLPINLMETNEIMMMNDTTSLISSIINSMRQVKRNQPEVSPETAKNSSTVVGNFIGDECTAGCNEALNHVVCNTESNRCECEDSFPVLISSQIGCATAKKLGEQCFYEATCQYYDGNSQCAQVQHNAICQCVTGYHSVTYYKPSRRVFCTQDIEELTSDLPTLLSVSSGIAVLAGLICMVLRLFSKNKFPHAQNYVGVNITPPIMYSTEIVQRPSSRSSIRSNSSIGLSDDSNHRRYSSALTNRNPMVTQSYAGTRRPSLASVHSAASSNKNYSIMRFEKELQQKEIRQEMKLRLFRLQKQHQQDTKPKQRMPSTSSLNANTRIGENSQLLSITLPNNDDETQLASVAEAECHEQKPIMKIVNQES